MTCSHKHLCHRKMLLLEEQREAGRRGERREEAAVSREGAREGAAKGKGGLKMKEAHQCPALQQSTLASTLLLPCSASHLDGKSPSKAFILKKRSKTSQVLEQQVGSRSWWSALKWRVILMQKWLLGGCSESPTWVPCFISVPQFSFCKMRIAPLHPKEFCDRKYMPGYSEMTG